MTWVFLIFRKILDYESLYIYIGLYIIYDTYIGPIYMILNYIIICVNIIYRHILDMFFYQYVSDSLGPYNERK